MSATPWKDEVTIYFILGVPGVGKGTLCALIAKDFPIYHLSVGDYLRELKSQQGTGLQGIVDVEELTAYLKDRRLLPPEIIVPLLRHKIEKEHANGYRHFFVDGFPRSVESAVLFEEQIGAPFRVLHFECDPDEALRRFIARGRETGDNADTWVKRYEEFIFNNGKIIQRFGIMTLRIDTNPPTDYTYSLFKKRVEEMLGMEAWRRKQKKLAEA